MDENSSKNTTIAEVSSTTNNNDASLPVVKMKASQHKRFLNFLIDFYIQIIILLIIFNTLSLIFNGISYDENNFILNLFLDIIFMLAYYVFFESIWGKTPAKFITKTKVLKKDETPTDLKTILLRSICRIIPFDILSFLFSRNPIGWHDRFSQTIVIDEKNNKPSILNTFQDLGLLLVEYIGVSAIFLIIIVLFSLIFSILLPENLFQKKQINIDKSQSSITPKPTLIVKEYSNPTLGITFNYLDGWIIKDNYGKDSPIQLMLTNGKSADFRVLMPYLTNDTLEINTSNLKQQVQALSRHKSFTEESDMVINGLRFHKIVEYMNEDGQAIKSLYLLTIKNGKIYSFGYNANEDKYYEFLPEANTIINSLIIQ